MKIFGKEFQIRNRPIASFTAAVVDNWAVRPDPLPDSVNCVSEMFIDRVAEEIAVSSEDLWLKKV